MPALTPKSPKTTHFHQQQQKIQQSAARCLYRHQQDTIIPPPPSPWQQCAVVRCWCHSPDPKTRKWHQGHRGTT
eukprot:2414913-Ditylum_brightwellii.AAC.1